MSDELKIEAKRMISSAIESMGGQVPAAARTGLDTSQLSRWANEDEERHVSLWQAIRIDDASGHQLLKLLARRVGAEVTFSSDGASAAENIMLQAATFAKAAGDFNAAVHEAAADNVCTVAEERHVFGLKQICDRASDRFFASLAKLRPSHHHVHQH